VAIAANESSFKAKRQACAEHAEVGCLARGTRRERERANALLRFVTHSRYNFGTFEKRERRWFSVYATPAKAFSVFPNLLCKQGAAGSSPATSTNLFPFKKIARESVPNTTCYSSRWSGFRIALLPPTEFPLSQSTALLFLPHYFGATQDIRDNRVLSSHESVPN